VSSVSDGVFEPTRRAWRVESRVARYKARQGWIDAGERRGILSLADEVRGEPILDLGVGAGRTTPLMRLLTDDYVGVDLSPEMVSAARSSYPGIDVREGDARDLSFIGSSTVKFVFFSFNGIDYVDHEGRCGIIAEIARVLRPDGIFAYSTLARSGVLYGERPWHLRRSGSGTSLLHAVASVFLRLPQTLRKYPSRYRSWFSNQKNAEDHESWAVAPAAHADFGLVHFTTIAGDRALLGREGIEIALVLNTDGNELVEDSACDATPWYFIIGRNMDSGIERNLVG
jgi:SAM-dependent methyltransferase